MKIKKNILTVLLTVTVLICMTGFTNNVTSNAVSYNVPVATEDVTVSTKVFDGYNVTVLDNTTLATTASGNASFTVYTFYTSNGKALGSISGEASSAIRAKYQATGEAPYESSDIKIWFAEQFNLYRGLSSSTDGSDSSPTFSSFDASAAASELARLINKQRFNEGIYEYRYESNIALLAQIRANELVESFSHIRLGGGTVADIGYAEIIHCGESSAPSAFQAYYNSSSHKNVMLSERYTSFGVACYSGEKGTYWVVLFSE